jgi:hypothetical protein
VLPGAGSLGWRRVDRRPGRLELHIIIVLWLGHESIATTNQYVKANLAMKEQALARLQEPANLVRTIPAT